MRKRGVTQSDLAPVFGVAGQSAVTGYLTGRRQLKVHQLIKLAEFFGVSADELIAGHRLDEAARVARERVAEVVADAVKEKGASPEQLCRSFGGVRADYLIEFLDGTVDIQHGDVRTLGPMLGAHTAMLLVDIISDRDGAPVGVNYG